MIGDRLDNDIILAMKFGMKTIWVKQEVGEMGCIDLLENKPDITILDFINIINCV